MRQDATLKPLELAILRGDRVTFERRRREIASKRDDLTAHAAMRFEVLSAAGSGVFGHRRDAEERLKRAIYF